MKLLSVCQLAFVGVATLLPASGATITLNDWCVNVNGNIAAACNGGAGPSLPSINLSAFDQTLSPTNNTLGTITVALAAGSNQYVSLYADYDVSFDLFGSFDDVGSTQGVPPAGITYSLDDPNTSNIFGDFSGNTLNNQNNVGTASVISRCCDVSFALAASGINIAPGGVGSVTFLISTTAPASGFYLQQTNSDTGSKIYAQATVTTPQITTATPEPSQAAGLAIGIAALLFVARRRQNQFTGLNSEVL